MTTWDPVTPIVDTPEQPRSYWLELPVFKVGDRVRVRLTGECRIPVVIGRAGSRGERRPETGHFDVEQGAIGTVTPCPNEEILHQHCEFHDDYQHPVVVMFDKQLRTGNVFIDGAHYAASELELLP